MKVFLTGATGFVGSAVAKELLAAGHTVVGLARSAAGADMLTAMGADVLRGELADLDCLRKGAQKADAVIHTAFLHDWSNFAASCALDKQAIETIGGTLEGSARPMLVTGGLATRAIGQGRLATENDAPAPVTPDYPRASEAAVDALVQRGVNVAVVRLPQVHDTRKQGLVTLLIALARQKGVSAYIGTGATCWSAVHVTDAARLYRLAIEKCRPGARYHAIAEESLSLRSIAEAIGHRLNLPISSVSAEEAPSHFGGFLAKLLHLELRGSSAQTRATLGWQPNGPTLLTDIEHLQLD